MEPSKVDQAWEKLLAAAHRLNVLGVLSDGEIQRVTDTKHILTTVQTIDRRKKYKLFLNDVLSDSGPGAVLLSAIALGQIRITDLKADERTKLCRLIQTNKHIYHPTISALAIQYQIPSSVKEIPSSLPIVIRSRDDDRQPVKRRRTSKTTEYADITPKATQSGLTPVLEISSTFTAAQEQRIIENASLQGIINVFDEYMCGAIRRVTVQGDLKAAITMVFPVWGGPVDCLMSLDICERDVEQLAMLREIVALMLPIDRSASQLVMYR